MPAEKAPVLRVIRGEWVRTVVAGGHVQSPCRVDIAAQIVEKVTDVPVAEGVRVRASAILALLDAREFDAAIEQA